MQRPLRRSLPFLCRGAQRRWCASTTSIHASLRPLAGATTPSTPSLVAGFRSEGEPCRYEVVDKAQLEKAIAEALTHQAPTPVPPKLGERLKKATSQFYQSDKKVPTSINYFPPTEVAPAYANHLVRELLYLRRRTERALLEEKIEVKEKVDKYASNLFYPTLKYTCFALLALQLGLYFNWIFFVFDWNLMEPTTYFLAYTGVFLSLVYHYHRCGREEFTYKNLFQYWSQREREKMYKKHNIATEKVEKLQERLKTIDKELDKYKL
ncbi:hypothetical protein AGDE_14173 [Angomonas deanei]|nr:hypothetical protein AGDE_14173 [Angomonas deanei]|eukprot:EPY21248.1 hypothetical protein AGDE_14173 [Angomonas deanei]